MKRYEGLPDIEGYQVWVQSDLKESEKLEMYERFKRFIAENKTDSWVMTEEDIKEKVVRLETEPLLTPAQKRELLN